MSIMTSRFAEIRRYPSAVAGLVVIGALIILSVYTLIAVPYDHAIYLWRGGESVWIDYPRNAAPAWFNLFPGVNLPTTMIIQSKDQPNSKVHGRKRRLQRSPYRPSR